MVTKGPGRPGRYKLADGTIVPSVTTICSRFKDAGGLIQWAYKQGLEGKPLREQIEEAGDIGRQIHDWIEKDINGEKTQPQEDPRVQSGVEAWLKWKWRWVEEFTHTEIPLVSATRRFGGTFDALGVESQTGKVVLLDWKSSGSVYTENLCQLGAYAILIDECMDIKVEGFHLVRFSKEHGDLEHRHYDDLSDARRLFELYLDAYRLDQQVKKRAR